MLLLSAGLGTRLKPLTENWPKCLMPIHKVPLLDYWLSLLKEMNINDVHINVHHKSEILGHYIQRPRFLNWVKMIYEKELLGTAGTVRNNKRIFYNKPLLLIHSDNWSGVDLKRFILDSQNQKKEKVLFSMLTFNSLNPKLCGVVTVDENFLVTQFQEKSETPKSNLANGAVYYLFPELVNWICDNQHINDFSLDVIPQCLGKIITWHNTSYHRDIGTIEELRRAQEDPKRALFWNKEDRWLKEFEFNKIHEQVNEIK